jgi:hypothetical protein
VAHTAPEVKGIEDRKRATHTNSASAPQCREPLPCGGEGAPLALAWNLGSLCAEATVCHPQCPSRQSGFMPSASRWQADVPTTYPLPLRSGDAGEPRYGAHLSGSCARMGPGSSTLWRCERTAQRRWVQRMDTFLFAAPGEWAKRDRLRRRQGTALTALHSMRRRVCRRQVKPPRGYTEVGRGLTSARRAERPRRDVPAARTGVGTSAASCWTGITVASSFDQFERELMKRLFPVADAAPAASLFPLLAAPPVRTSPPTQRARPGIRERASKAGAG